MADWQAHLKVKEVQGLETILEFNHENKNWKSFIQLIKLRKQEGHDTEVEGLAITKFYRFINDFIDRNGLFFPKEYISQRGHNPNCKLEIWRDKPTTIRLRCKEVVIIPPKTEFTYADKYTPNLEFTATPETLTATCSLSGGNKWKFMVLEDFLTSMYKNGDGIKTPKIKLGANKQYSNHQDIQVASLEQTQKVLKDLQELYQRIGEERLSELSELKSYILSSKQGGGKYVQALLEKEYGKMKGLLLPVKN